MWSMAERGAWGNVEHGGMWSMGDVAWGVVWSEGLCGVGGCVE